MQSYKITYISNAGVMLRYDDKKILIDGFCNSMVPIYKSPPPQMMENMIYSIPPFDNIDAVLFTHHHSDHFDVKSTVQFMNHSKDSVIISTDEVIQEITGENLHLDAKRLIELNPPLHGREDIMVKGVSIKAFFLTHDGKEYEDVKNLAYLIDINGKKILHVGDAKPAEENYINLNLLQEDIDLLIAPFPYVSIPRGRQVIKNHINPKKIAAVHLPYKERDDFRWISAAKRSYMRVQDDFIETVFLEDIGDLMSI